MESTVVQRWIRKFRLLILTLILSGALNIGLIAAVAAILLQDRQKALSYPAPALANAPGEEATNLKMIGAYSHLSFRELCALLTNSEPVEEGYRKKDLALSMLVSFHHFNLEKALGGAAVQRRILHTEGARTVELFPSLTEDQFQAILRFAYLEKWPLTAQGLFAQLQKTPKPRDPELEAAFAATNEFYVFRTLFQKSGAPVEQSDLIDLIFEGTWPMLDGFCHEQTQMIDLSEERRRRLLLSYFAVQSSAAARLLLQTDFNFLCKRLDDPGILDLLHRCTEPSEPVRNFCLELLKSPRSDAVWVSSAEILYRFSGEQTPQPFDRLATLQRFGIGNSPAALIKPMSAPVRTHIVAEGESLWKIARQYRVKLEELVSLNGLEKDRIVPGMVLSIPQGVQGTGSEPPR